MKGIDKKLFPEDSEWLKGSYADLREMFGSFEYFAKYIRKRFPSAKESEIEGIRAAFLIEGVEVHWKAEIERVRVHVGYGSSTIKVFLPDLAKYSDADRERLEGEYLDRYASRIKESHIRMNALLWYLLSESKKSEIAKHFPEDIDPAELNLFGSEKK